MENSKALSLTGQTWPSLPETLVGLRLWQVLSDVDDIIAECERQKMPLEGAVRTIFGIALRRRQSHRQEMQLTMARFPTPATFENFDLSKIDQRSRQCLLDLSICKWINAGENILLQGASGVGKTHLAVAIGRRAIAQGYRTLFVEAKSLLCEMRHWQQTGALTEKLKQLNQIKLLILDDVGNKDDPNPEDCTLFSALIRSRYAAHRSVIITSSTMPAGWFMPRPDQVPTLVAAVDRLVHHCHLIKLQGRSYRLDEFQTRIRDELGSDCELITGQNGALAVELAADDKSTATDTVQ